MLSNEAGRKVRERDVPTGRSRVDPVPPLVDPRVLELVLKPPPGADPVEEPGRHGRDNERGQEGEERVLLQVVECLVGILVRELLDLRSRDGEVDEREDGAGDDGTHQARGEVSVCGRAAPEPDQNAEEHEPRDDQDQRD